jgi:molecular chaperone GrpE (heat shock protein)
VKKKIGEEGSSIGEMMLAKTVLEEKNEALESKDRQIRELTGRLRRLSEEAAEQRAEAERSGRRQAELLRSERLEGAREVLQSVVGFLADWGEAEPALAARLLALLGERHGLEVIDRVQGRLDPRLHRVLEVQRDKEPGAEVLAQGYRLGERVLRPAFVKVSLAADGPPSA